MNDLLKLSPRQFDSAKTGWRMYDSRGDYKMALTLLKRYVGDRYDEIEADPGILVQTFYFHIGQMYACLGREYYKDAVLYFEKSRKNRAAWDIYVDATIAFINADSLSLDRNHRLLKNIVDDGSQLLVIVSSFREGLIHDLSYIQAYEGI